MDYDKKIGALLRYLRDEKGLTQAEVGRIAGLSASGYRDVEQGRSSARIEVLKKLMRFFNISLSGVLEMLERGEDLVPGDPEFIVTTAGVVYRLVTDDVERESVSQSRSAATVVLEIVDRFRGASLPVIEEVAPFR